MRYGEYLRSKGWDRKKNSIRNFKFTNRRCAICGNKKTDTHHKTYKRLGNETESDLVFLCRYHHFRAHDFCKENNLDLYTGTQKYIEKSKKIPRKLKWTKHMIHVYRISGKIPEKKDFL